MTEIFLEKLQKELEEEAAQQVPNLSKMLLGILVSDTFMGTKEILDILRKLYKVDVKSNTPSATMNFLYQPRASRPIAKLIERKRLGNRWVYRLPTPVAKLGLHKLHELSRAKGSGSISLRDVEREIPELKEKLDKAEKFTGEYVGTGQNEIVESGASQAPSRQDLNLGIPPKIQIEVVVRIPILEKLFIKFS